MKKLIILFAIALYAVGNIYAQVVYETTYVVDTNNALLGKIKLNQTITKYLAANYYIYDSPSPGGDRSYNITYKLYNLDHSLYKTLPLITDSMLNPNPFPFSIQENLFNTNADIEIAYIRKKNKSTSFKVIDETGALIFERDTVLDVSNNIVNCLQQDGIFNTESGTKLILTINGKKNGNVYFNRKEIYSLGGVLISTPNNISNSNDDGMIELSPNPAKEFTRISYQLPANENTGEIVIYNINGSEIKRYTVDRTFADIIVSNDDLPSGNYFYTLVANNQIIGTKKSFVIK